MNLHRLLIALSVIIQCPLWSDTSNQTILAAEVRLMNNSSDLEAYVIKAQAFAEVGDYDHALQTYFEGLSLNPDIIDVQFGKEISPWLPEDLMTIGTYKLEPGKALRSLAELHNKTLLVHFKKGHGDTIQFYRFLKPLIELGNPAKVLLVPQKHLVQLLQDSCLDERIEVVHPDSDLSQLRYDVHTHLLALPRLVGTTINSIPLKNRYLRTAPAQGIEDLMGEHAGLLKVGLIWQGDPSHIHDRDRSTSLQNLSVLRNIPGFKFYSLQTFAGSEQLDDPTNRWDDALVDLGQFCNSFADVAAFMQRMDLIITVDTAGAHLASALGRPNIILIPKKPDLRWVGDGPANPWSEHSILLRQARSGDWTELMERLESTVRDLKHSKL